MNNRHLLIVVFIVWNPLCVLSNDGEKSCNIDELFICSEGEACKQKLPNQTIGVCVCLKNYTRKNSSAPCMPITDVSIDNEDFSNGISAAAIATGLLVPVISLAIIVTLIFVARRYRWIHRIREQAHQLSVSDYDTVLVGQDDQLVR